MDISRLRDLLEKVQKGQLEIDQALGHLRSLPYEDLGFARVDHHRALRQGFPEVIFCPGKTPEQVAEIAFRLSERSSMVLATRASQEVYEAVVKLCPQAEYRTMARAIVLEQGPLPPPSGRVLVVSAGTSDLPVAEEAAVCAEAMGRQVTRLYDVGVAGLHRLLDRQEALWAAQAIIVVAGMEGALASVVGGMVDKPVIAVPTSVGYGANFGGLSALLTMLNSCASGIGVVNIDNGFGAAALAHAILRVAENQ
ncbi:MAG: nickel pincer cofactor biosynthesis protein LarB [Bacillota bacterium]